MAQTLTLDLPQLVAMAAALGWASGLRLYAVVFITGAGGYLGWVPLPAGLQVLQHPVVLGASLLHVGGRVRGRQDPRRRLGVGRGAHASSASPPARRWPPASSAATRPPGPRWRRWLGGTLAATAHTAKATTRAAVNTSPEPFSNLALSLAGDAAVPGLLWLAWEQPCGLLPRCSASPSCWRSC